MEKKRIFIYLVTNVKSISKQLNKKVCRTNKNNNYSTKEEKSEYMYVKKKVSIKL